MHVVCVDWSSSFKKERAVNVGRGMSRVKFEYGERWKERVLLRLGRELSIYPFPHHVIARTLKCTFG